MDIRAPQEDPDSDLIELLVDSEWPSSALREFERRYTGRLDRLFVTRGFPQEDREELIQDTLLRVYSSIQSFRGECRFSSWVYMLAKRIAINRARYNSAQSRSGNEFSLDQVSQLPESGVSRLQPLTPMPDPQKNVLTAERLERLKIEIARLPPRQRRCFKLWMMGYSMKDIATLLRIKIGTVKAHVHQARQRLMTQFEDLL